MPKSNSYKSKQFLFLLIKLSIVFGAAYFIYIRLIKNDQLNIDEFWVMLSSNHILNFSNGSMLLSLTILNWFFEVLKWKSIVTPVKEINFKESVKQSFGSLTASLFTPNRIGEYGAKVLYFERIHRKKIVVITLINNMGQMLITICMGLLGFIFFIKLYTVTIAYTRLYLLIGSVLLILTILFFLFSQKNLMIGNVPLRRLKKFIKSIPKKIFFTNLGFAFLRYLVFSYQFYFLISLFSPQISYPEAMVGIITYYLISSILPMLFIFDVIIKSSLAVWVFSFLGVNELAIITIVTLMWILNFVTPALLGSYYVLNFSFNTAPKAINNKL